MEEISEYISERCQNCKFWHQFSPISGFCDDVNNSKTETLFDSWCEKWERNDEL